MPQRRLRATFTWGGNSTAWAAASLRSRRYASWGRPDAGIDDTIRMISIGQPRRAAPLTGAMCLAAAK